MLELKNTIIKMKDSIESFNIRSNNVDERISELKDKSFEVSQLEEQLQ